MKLAILSCNGMDKTEGSLAREVAIRVAEETGAEIVCPVLLNRIPARYKKLLAENALVVVDGCATRCASKLAATMGAKPERKVLVWEVAKAAGQSLEDSLRLGPNEMALVRTIADGLISSLNAPAAAAETAADWEAPAEFLTVVCDKFEFRIPKSEYLFNENDVWVRVSGNRARAGISDYMQQRLTDINYFDPPQTGAVVGQFGELGSVESTKAVFEIVSPVSGTVVATNPAVEEIPELANEDPYGRGWLAEIELSDWQNDRELLLDGPAYAETLGRKAAEE